MKACQTKPAKSALDRLAIQKELVKETQEYRRKVELGKIINDLLREDDTLMEIALDQEKKDAVKLYRQSQAQYASEYENVELRPWQEEVMSFIQTPTEREIIWVVGKDGNEGKTFLQNYIRYYCGERRVITSDITGEKKHIAHYLSKKPLACKDIFLFNHPCSNTEAVAYDLLEGIKDGVLLSHKYNTAQLVFNTPNTVIVFSNVYPDVSALKQDRWNIYEINGQELHPVDTSVPSRKPSSPMYKRFY